MAGGLLTEGQPTDNTSRRVDMLNRALQLLNLLPVSALNFVGGEDGMLVYNEIVRVFRTECAKGWYLFNRQDGQQGIVNQNGLVLFAPPPLMCLRPREDRITAPWRYRLNASGQGEIRRMYPDPSTGQATWPQNTIIPYDVITGCTFDTTHPLFIDWCAVKAAANLAPSYGVALDPGVVSQARDALVAAEAEATPRFNVFTDDPELAITWQRPYY